MLTKLYSKQKQPLLKLNHRYYLFRKTLTAVLQGLFLLLCLIQVSQAASTYDISTIAGGGVGDGGLATSATFNNPTAVAIDSSGNTYIADSYNHRIRKIDNTGMISTIAGTGSGGYSGDGSAATTAKLYYSSGVAVDGSGNVYIADYFNHRIRKIEQSTGNISTIAGTGAAGYSGDGSAAISAKLNYPFSVAIDSGDNVYIADSANNRIRKIDQSTGNISTIAGTGTAGYSIDGFLATNADLNNPLDIAIDSVGNVYIADSTNHRIRKIDQSTGNISTIAGTGTAGYSGDGSAATSAKLYHPSSVAVDSSGNVYIADPANNRIRKIDQSTSNISTIAGMGTSGYSGDGSAATSATLNSPNNVAVDSDGNVYIADTSNHRIRKIDKITSNISTIAGTGITTYSGDGSAAASATLYYPAGVSVDSSDNVYIADANNNRIRKIDKITGNISTIAGTGSTGYSGDGSAAINATLYYPNGAAADSAGNVYIADPYNYSLRKIDKSTGNISTIASGFPVGVAVDSFDNVYLADSAGNRIRKIDNTGNISTIAGTGTSGYSGNAGLATNATLNYPNGVAVDSNGNVYIADTSNHSIRKIDKTTGNISTIAGTGTSGYSGDGAAATSATLNSPNNVAVDSDGNVYIADTSNHRIRKIDKTTGNISTIAGTGTSGYSGDGSVAISATLYNPRGIAVDSSGNIYIGDTSNHCIRKLTPNLIAQTISFTPASTATYGDSIITLSATGGASGNPVTFASTTTSVCTVSGTSLTIVSAGTCTVTADQAGNASYSAAPQVSKNITVAKKSITAQADNKSRALGAANPTFTISYTGLINSDSSSAINTPPTASTTATTGSPTGNYVITCNNSSSSASNYIISTCTDGTLAVGKATPSISLTPASPSSSLGSALTVNFTVTGTPTPTGTVTVSDGTNSCTATVVAGTCSFTPATSGAKTLTATYAGDSNYTTATQTNTVNIAQVVLSSTSINVTEAGATGSYTVKLSTQPASDVTINLTPNAQVTISPATLTFTTTNWNTPQTVTVTAVDNSTYQGSRTVQIAHAITTGDGADYPTNLSISSVNVNITDNEAPPYVPPSVSYYNLSVKTTGTGKGTVGGTSAGIYAQGTTVTLTATVDASSTFVAWTPASCASTFALNADTVCSAQFDLKPVVMTTTPIISAAANPCIRNLSLNTSCSGAGEKTTIIEIGVSGELSNSIIDAPIISKGWLSNSLVTAKGRITGGFITGYLENLGIVSDIEFKGRYIKGGFLSGKIINSSTVGGYLENVTFTASASLTGGILQGNIKGNPNAPALLENVTIKQGSVLWGVTLGKGVILEAGVIVKENINLPILESPTALDATGKSILTSSLFYGGISVNGKPFVRSAVQLLAEPVVIRGRVIPEPEHVGKKADLFVYSPYWSSTTNLDSTPLSYYSADDKANILAWDQKIPTLVAFKKGMNLDSVHEVDMFVGNFIATGGLSIVFGYRLEDGTVIMNTVPNTIAVTIQ